MSKKKEGRKYFWNHGVNTQVEYPDHVEFIRHWGGGTQVRQRAGTSNWFHIAVPVETFFNAKRATGGFERFQANNKIQVVYLNATLNENAIINHVHVWEGNQRIAAFDGTDRRGLDLRGPDVYERFDVPDRILTNHNGIVVCVRVEFLSGGPQGEVNFNGAGVRLYQG